MKLLTRTSIYYLAFSLVLFLAGGIIFFVQLRELTDEDATENLYHEKDQVIQFVKDSARIPVQSIHFKDRIAFTKAPEPVSEQLKDTFLYNTLEEELQPFRQLIFTVQIEGQNYSVVLSKPMFESEDLIDAIGFSLFLIAFITLLLLLILLRIISKKLWKPFYHSLELLKKFEITGTEPVNFSPAKIYEFNRLNEELKKMTDKILNDYQSLKNFTENASHEIQTPLAIMRSKLELMIQHENLNEETTRLLQDVYETANRLSKLNQSLLLLAKIENRQFHETEMLDLKSLVENKLAQFKEMIAFRNITVEKNSSGSPVINMNVQLADILLSNLFSNAMKHNIGEGKIIIEIKSDSLIISNTGTATEAEPEKFFGRFQKANPSSDSAGLGLAIAKEICDSYNFSLHYRYSGNMHIISVDF